jgi:hypothetical protein
MSLTHVPAELRRLVRERANGCCEYCQVPERASFALHEVDHIVAEKHGGETSADNLAFCCTLCNRRKGTDLASVDPQTGEPALLFHPRKQRWLEHFRLNGPRIEPLTATGRATARLLGFNAEARLAERAALPASKS